MSDAIGRETHVRHRTAGANGLNELAITIFHAIKPFLETRTPLDYTGLGKRLGISRHSVSRKISSLIDAGLLKRIGGRGVFALGTGEPEARARKDGASGPMRREVCLVDECYDLQAPGARFCPRHKAMAVPAPVASDSCIRAASRDRLMAGR